jgi:hypothetical protein
MLESYCNGCRNICLYYNELLAASTNKSNTAWSIINNEIATKNKENFTPLQFKLGNKTVPLTQVAEVFNDLFLQHSRLSN